MSEGAFQTFMTGGMLLLVTGVLAIGWLLWRLRDDREDAERAALEGVTHEFRLNLQRMLGELMALSGGAAFTAGSLMDVRHPQLDAVNRALVQCDRRTLAVIGGTYQELEARKRHLRAEREAGRAGEHEQADAIQAAIDGVATLYMWDAHDGCRPTVARSTRSWDVRKWMMTNGFGQFELPGLHLRDAVVERLRQYGMRLTPKPLEYTAFEYWSMRYDRKMDRGFFGKRRVDEPVEPEDEVLPEHDQAVPVWEDEMPPEPIQNDPQEMIDADSKRDGAVIVG